MVDLDALGRGCASLGADVLGLQEVDVGMPRSGGRDLAQVVACATGLAVVFGAATTFGDGEYGNALLVRGAITAVEVVPLPSPRRHEPRSVLVASVDLAGGPSLSVAVTHLSYDREEAALQLPLAIDALAGRAGPRILLGDLNLETAQVATLVTAAGLHPVRAGGPTFSARWPRRRIDHVALAGLTAGAATTPRLPVSDHRALVVEVEVCSG